MKKNAAIAGLKKPLIYLVNRGFLAWMNDELYIRFRFWARFHRKLNLEHPKTYSEKLQWLKLYDRNPQYTMMVDKYAVKKYVADKIGEEHIIPTLGVWDTFEDINFDELPEQFVLKCTHDSGGIIICKNKADLDLELTKKKINRWLHANYYYQSREWPYKNVKPRILAEAYMVDESGVELKDYKFFCFDGEVKAMFIATERQAGKTKFDFFDRNFTHLPIKHGYPNSEKELKKPIDFEHMLTIAEALSEGFVHLRVDLYSINERIYFGELTFFHHSGIVPFDPPEWDDIFGSWLTLPNRK